MVFGILKSWVDFGLGSVDTSYKRTGSLQSVMATLRNFANREMAARNTGEQKHEIHSLWQEICGVRSVPIVEMNCTPMK